MRECGWREIPEVANRLDKYREVAGVREDPGRTQSRTASSGHWRAERKAKDSRDVGMETVGALGAPCSRNL